MAIDDKTLYGHMKERKVYDTLSEYDTRLNILPPNGARIHTRKGLIGSLHETQALFLMKYLPADLTFEQLNQEDHQLCDALVSVLTRALEEIVRQ